MKRVLLIEDDPAISFGLKESLLLDNYEVTVEANGAEGLNKIISMNYDLVLLDWNLPDMNGFDICREARERKISLPIIMLTSRKESIDKILGLEIGADDYVTKPFDLRELLSRIKALFRRSEKYSNHETDSLQIADVKIDFKNQEVTKAGSSVQLSLTEFKLLKFLVVHPDETISREKILDEVWGYDSYPTTRTVDNYILSLRKLLEDDPSEPKHILTVPKQGYKFKL